MKIAVIGAGAMGMLYAGYLSKAHETYLVGRDAVRMAAAAQNGITITEKDGRVAAYHPHAIVSSKGIGVMDVVILLTKAMDSHTALAAHPHFIGEDTILMTLQNGAGHESVLECFAPVPQLAIGTTQHGCSISGENTIRHSGVGPTVFGMVSGDLEKLAPIEAALNECGLEAQKTPQIKELIWNKLMINTSSSVMAGLLAMPQGYCLDDAYAWGIVQSLIKESVAVANADGMDFDAKMQIARVETLLSNARAGLVGIYADLQAGRMTEVDTISGSVVARGNALGVPTPTHTLIVQIIHAMERRADYQV